MMEHKRLDIVLRMCAVKLHHLKLQAEKEKISFGPNLEQGRLEVTHPELSPHV